jgi:hypothetical protein
MAWAASDFACAAAQGQGTAPDALPARLRPLFGLGAAAEGAGSAAAMEDFAPVLGPRDAAAARRFLATLAAIPHERVAELQAQALAPVWEALECADPGLAPLEAAGRADIPFTRSGLRGLYLDIARYLHVVQTQLPLIVPDSEAHAAALENAQGGVPGAESFHFSYAFVTGANKEALSRVDTATETEEELVSRFGFLSIRREGDAGAPEAQGAARARRLFALPVLTLDGGILSHMLAAPGGLCALRDLQHIVGIVNHDYFHHFTARMLNPYFGKGRRDVLLETETPLARLLGGSAEKRHTSPLRQESSYILGMKAEQAPRFHHERYGRAGGEWEDLFGADPYEFHALHLHRRLYIGHLDGGAPGREMRAHLVSLFSSLRKLPPAPDRPGQRHNTADLARLYISALVYSNLLRIVPHTHSLARECERLIDAAGIPPALLAREQAARRARADERALDEADAMAGLAGNPKSAGECIRWQAYAMNALDINRIHMDFWRDAQESALPAMRQYLSAVQRDIQLAKWRGGLEALDAIGAARKKPEPPAVT